MRKKYLFIFVCLAITGSLYGNDLSFKDVGDIIKEIVTLKDGRKKSSAEEILDYALLALKLDFSFDEYTMSITKQISEMYRKTGNIKKAVLTEKLGRPTAVMFAHTSYEPYYGVYEKEWLQAKKLFEGGDFEEAIQISQGNPYLLAKIAAIYLGTGQKEKADVLLAKAYEDTINSKDKYLKHISLPEIVSLYKKAKEYDKAISIISNIPDDFNRDRQFSDLAKEFSKNKEFDRAFKLLTDIKNTEYQADVLIAIANGYNENNLELDNNKREILRKIAHLAK